MTNQTFNLTWKSRIAYGLFWSWNIIFLAFMVLGFAPRLLPDTLLEVRNGTIPVAYLIYALVLSIVPLLAVILGLTLLRRAPGRLFALGYVVEGPLMLILAIRFFLIRQATPALTFLLITAWLGMAAFLWHTLDPEIERRGRFSGYLRLFGLTLMMLTSLYAAVWIAFYAFPLSGAAYNWLVDTLGNLAGSFRSLWDNLRSLFQESLIWVIPTILGFILVLYTLTLFAIAPLAIPFLSVRAWWRSLHTQALRSGWLKPLALVALTLVVTSGLAYVTNRQPQQRAFKLLEKPPVTQKEVQELLKQRNSIRAGLLNAYLAPFRYFSAVGEVRHVSDLYIDTLKFSSPAAAEVQQLYESVARPLLYEPVHPQEIWPPSDNLAFQREPEEAARLYQRFFDTPITQGERETIVNAVRSTWSATEAEAAWQAVDDREVRLAQQEINISEHGDWADVELFEVYRNQTSRNQEVIYYFSLPESAVLTGVWLGNNPDRAQRFEFQVAPRGAAQAVYRDQARRNIDPALLEQIGPRQYRLRAFPVPPTRMTWNDAGTTRIMEDAPPLYLWLTYRTLANGDAWPLPRLAEVRNVYWDADTLRLVNGKAAPADDEHWLPESIPASQPVTPVAHRVDLSGGTSVLALPASGVQLPALPDNLRLAVVLDRSYSMNTHQEQVSATLSRLQELTGQGDVYLTASVYRGEPPTRLPLQGFDPQGIVYFGGQNAAELLAQFAALRADQAYDAVLVLTDGSGYELGASQVEVPSIEVPVWMLHLDGDISLGYDDATLQVIQASGGGVAGDLEQALQRLALALPTGEANPGAGATGQDLLDGYLWSVVPTDQAAQQTSGASISSGEDGFAALAARQVILAEIRQQRGALDQVETLDRLHALAQQYAIVTPYSSMIVLVTPWQQTLLDKMSTLEDRYDREHEAVQDTVPATNSPLTGVPEPEEWLLLGLAAALLAWVAFRQRFAFKHQNI